MKRTPNLNPELVKKIAESVGLQFVPEKVPSTSSGTEQNTFAPVDLLDYIYAVLHSPSYRQKYKEFLKIDFPRVPYPSDKAKFWQLVELGGQIRGLHLLESPLVEEYITSYPIDGDNIITRKMTTKSVGWVADEHEPSIGKVWINDSQYFEGVPQVAWEFYVGGYQPAQKWLKDRKGRTLGFEDILHYQKIICSLYHTDRIMKEIDELEAVADATAIKNETPVK